MEEKVKKVSCRLYSKTEVVPTRFAYFQIVSEGIEDIFRTLSPAATQIRFQSEAQCPVEESWQKFDFQSTAGMEINDSKENRRGTAISARLDNYFPPGRKEICSTRILRSRGNVVITKGTGVGPRKTLKDICHRLSTLLLYI